MVLERISKAFYLGYLLSLGRRFAMDRAMAMDAKRDLRDVRLYRIRKEISNQALELRRPTRF